MRCFQIKVTVTAKNSSPYCQGADKCKRMYYHAKGLMVTEVSIVHPERLLGRKSDNFSLFIRLMRHSITSTVGHLNIYENVFSNVHFSAGPLNNATGNKKIWIGIFFIMNRLARSCPGIDIALVGIRSDTFPLLISSTMKFAQSGIIPYQSEYW